MPRKPKRSTLSNRADKLWSLAIRSVGVCQAAGKDDVTCGGVLQACHIEGRRNYHLRFDLLNGICMCSAHHRWYTDYPIAWAEFVQRHFPCQWLHVRAERGKMWDRQYEPILERLKAATEAL